MQREFFANNFSADDFCIYDRLNEVDDENVSQL